MKLSIQTTALLLSGLSAVHATCPTVTTNSICPQATIKACAKLSTLSIPCDCTTPLPTVTAVYSCGGATPDCGATQYILATATSCDAAPTTSVHPIGTLSTTSVHPIGTLSTTSVHPIGTLSTTSVHPIGTLSPSTSIFETVFRPTGTGSYTRPSSICYALAKPTIITGAIIQGYINATTGGVTSYITRTVSSICVTTSAQLSGIDLAPTGTATTALVPSGSGSETKPPSATYTGGAARVGAMPFFRLFRF